MESTEDTIQLIWTIYGIILLYFLLGGIGFYIINRKKRPDESRKSYVKFFTYFIIINVLFASIVLRPVIFRYLSLVIIGLGSYEIIRLYVHSGYRFGLFFSYALVVFFLFSFGFYTFSGLPYGLVLYAFLVASIFDSFSQITGQLWGHHKILPKISPSKTTGGVLGGAVIAVISGFLLRQLYETSIQNRIFLTSGIVLFAFAGDALASLYKRKYQVKDYSYMIPGHGGVMDRFDSLIACGAWVVFYFYFLK